MNIVSELKEIAEMERSPLAWRVYREAMQIEVAKLNKAIIAREKTNAQQRRHYKEDPSIRTTRSRKYYLRHKAERHASNVRWRKANPEKSHIINRRSEARQQAKAAAEGLATTRSQLARHVGLPLSQCPEELLQFRSDSLFLHRKLKEMQNAKHL